MALALPVTHCLPLGVSLNGSWHQISQVEVMADAIPSREAQDKRSWCDNERPKVFCSNNSVSSLCPKEGGPSSSQSHECQK